MKIRRNNITCNVEQEEYQAIIKVETMIKSVISEMYDDDTMYTTYTKEDLMFISDFLRYLDEKVFID